MHDFRQPTLSARHHCTSRSVEKCKPRNTDNHDSRTKHDHFLVTVTIDLLIIQQILNIWHLLVAFLRIGLDQETCKLGCNFWICVCLQVPLACQIAKVLHQRLPHQDLRIRRHVLHQRQKVVDGGVITWSSLPSEQAKFGSLDFQEKKWNQPGFCTYVMCTFHQLLHKNQALPRLLANVSFGAVRCSQQFSLPFHFFPTLGAACTCAKGDC